MKTDQKGKRGPAKGEGGRPRGPEKVRLSCWILPETRDVLGEQPGQFLDREFSREKK